MRDRRHRGALASLICLAFMLAAPAPPASMQQTGVLSLPVVGEETQQTLARGESHEWRVELAASEFIEISVELTGIVYGDSDEWPDITVASPDGRIVYESVEPSVTIGVEVGSRMIVALIADRSGPHRVRIVSRQRTAPRMPYRLRVERREFAGEQERQRLAVHRLWREGSQLVTASRATMRASLDPFQKALTLLGDIQDREGEALTLGTIATVYYHLSDAAAGSAAAARALQLWRSLGREREEAIALSDLGVLAYLGYDHPLARTYYEQALPLHRSARDVVAEATTLVRLGWLEFAAGEMSPVIDLNQQAIPLWRKADHSTGESTSFNDLGRAYAELGDVTQALDAYKHSLTTRPSDVNPRAAGVVLMRMGQLYLSVADWPRAFDALQQALELVRRAKDARNEAAVLSNLGLAYHRIGDTDEALRYLEPALDLARKIPIRNVEANVLAVLGVDAYLGGDLERSRSYFQQALAIQEAITDVRGQATTLRYLATTQLALGSPRDALDSITRSLDKLQVGGAQASGLATLATIHAALGDAPRAEATYRQALDRAREIRARDQEAAVLAEFARFQARRGQQRDARDLLEQALTIHESLRGLLVDPDQRMSYSSRAVTPYEQYIDVLMEMERHSAGAGFAAEAFRTAERARGRGLLELLATSSVDIRQGVDETLVERERTLRWNLNAKAAIQTALLSGAREDRQLRALEKEIAELSSAWRETTTRMRQQSPAYASLSEPQPLSVADVSGLLDADTVLLEFAPGEAQSWLFAVTSTSFDTFALPPRRTIEDAARGVRDLLIARQPLPGDTAASRQTRVRRADLELAARSRTLSDLVLGPVGAKLANEWRGRRLALVAAGALEYVPFAQLPLPGSAREGAAPLIARHEIVSLPSASSLPFLRRERTRRAPPGKTIAVFADPVFAPDDPRVTKTIARRATIGGEVPPHALTIRALESSVADGSRASLARLPFSRAEASAVASQVPRGSLLQATDFDASLALATSGRLDDYRIIHFATHGLINTKRPELSGLALSLVDAQGRSRDGFLRLNTIYNLRLSADLVVLSACQTALGKEIAGEGLVGLTRGFMYAGARRVIASLWQVSDVATAELMKKFYAGMLQRHLPAAAALRSAQLEMANDPRWASPYYWGGFVLQGDWQQ